MHRSVRQTLTYFATIVASQGLAFLLLPLVTNYLSPALYGDYALVLSISSLVGTMGSSWIRNVGFRLFFEARASGTSRRFYVSIALFQAAVVAAAFGIAAVILGVVTSYVPATLMLAAGLSVIAGDFFSLSVSLVRAEQQAVHYSVAEVGSALLRFGATLAGLAAGIRHPAMLFLAAALASGALGAYAGRAVGPKLTGPAGFDRAVVAQLVRLGPASIPFSIATWAQRLMDRIILDQFLTRAVVGVYSANYAIGERIIGGLTQAVFLMAWPDILRSYKDHGKADARDAVTRAMRLYLWLTAGPAVFIGVFHQEMALLLGAAYREGSEIMPYIAAATWLQGFTTYLNRHLELTMRFAVLSWVAFAGAGVNLALNLILVPWLGIQGAALATLGNLVATAVYFWIIRDRDLVRLPGETMVNVVLLIAVALGLSRLPVAPYGRVVVFVLVYGSGAAFFVLRQFSRKPVGVPYPR